MIDAIYSTPELFHTVRGKCGENGVCVSIDEILYELENIAILKLDEYFAYNSKETSNPPCCIDNLIVVRCCDKESYSLYLIELRKSEGRRPTRRLHPKDIEKKFNTVVNDFFVRHEDIFSAHKIKSVKAYLVSDPWGMASKPDANRLFSEKLKTSCLDAYGFMSPLKILGHQVIIEPVLPPNPVVSPC